MSSTQSEQPNDGAGDPPRYHHGALRQALLEAAERILVRDGIEGLSLRGAAREAGVSHAAPKNHFGDVRGLLSELAAVGFGRLRAATNAEIEILSPAMNQLKKAGLGYVKFAKANPALFTLMFRSERLDFARPALRDASAAAFATFTAVAIPEPRSSIAKELTLQHAANAAAAWSLVHGFACLMLDGRLTPMLAQTSAGIDDIDLLEAILRRPPA